MALPRSWQKATSMEPEVLKITRVCWPLQACNTSVCSDCARRLSPGEDQVLNSSLRSSLELKESEALPVMEQKLKNQHGLNKALRFGSSIHAFILQYIGRLFFPSLSSLLRKRKAMKLELMPCSNQAGMSLCRWDECKGEGKLVVKPLLWSTLLSDQPQSLSLACRLCLPKHR